MNKPVFSARIPQELYDQAIAYTEQNNINKSKMLSLLIESFFEENISEKSKKEDPYILACISKLIDNQVVLAKIIKSKIPDLAPTEKRDLRELIEAADIFSKE